MDEGRTGGMAGVGCCGEGGHRDGCCGVHGVVVRERRYEIGEVARVRVSEQCGAAAAESVLLEGLAFEDGIGIPR